MPSLDLLGAARQRQDDARAHPRERDQVPLRALLGGDLRDQGDQGGDGGRRAPALGRGPAHAPVRRRDPPLQPRAAGRLPPLRRARRHRAGRRHHREPVVRAQLGAALALPRGGARAARGRRPGARCSSARSPTPSAAWGSRGVGASPEALESIAQLASGDARRALNLLEMAVADTPRGGALDAESVAKVAQRKVLLYDKAGEEHFNLISALHKSLRESDPDASLYWLARMLEAGEDPTYLARRMLRFASEDVGLADPQALTVALHAGSLRSPGPARRADRAGAGRDLSRARAQERSRSTAPRAPRAARCRSTPPSRCRTRSATRRRR